MAKSSTATTILYAALFTAGAALMFSCSTSSMGGSSGKQGGSPAPAQNASTGVQHADATRGAEAASPSQVPAGTSTAAATGSTNLTPAQAADVAACVKSWGQTPFSADQLANPQIIDLSADGIASGTDENLSNVTDAPELVYVSLKANGIASGHDLHLGNPKGWYCIATDSTGDASGNDISIDCHAHAHFIHMKSSGAASGDEIDQSCHNDSW